MLRIQATYKSKDNRDFLRSAFNLSYFISEIYNIIIYDKDQFQFDRKTVPDETFMDISNVS